MKKSHAPATAQWDFENQAGMPDSKSSEASRVDPLLDRSTETHAQMRRILAALRLRPRTSVELRSLGCYQAPTRIFALRSLGYSISTDRVVGVDADGYAHERIALYTLNEPSDDWRKAADTSGRA